jgi:predicted DNA binding protein
VTVLATIAIDADAFALGEVLSDGDTGTRVELTQFVPTADSLVPYFWVTHSADHDAFERHVRADPRVARLANLDGGVDRTLYRIEWVDDLDGFLDALSDHALFVERASGTAEEWLFRIRADTREALSAFNQACSEAGVPFDFHRIVQNPVASDSTPYGITDKQLAGLRLAFEEGYFHVPRETSQTELADQLGISRQAYSRRLDRALDSLVSNTVMEPFDFANSD